MLGSLNVYIRREKDVQNEISRESFCITSANVEDRFENKKKRISFCFVKTEINAKNIVGQVQVNIYISVTIRRKFE